MLEYSKYGLATKTKEEASTSANCQQERDETQIASKTATTTISLPYGPLPVSTWASLSLLSLAPSVCSPVHLGFLLVPLARQTL